MTIIEDNRRSLGAIGILCGFLLEAAAALPFLAPEVIWVSAEQSLWYHLVAALCAGGGASALFATGRGFGQWLGAALFFALLAAVIPGAGLVGVLLLTVIMISHYAQAPPKEIALWEVGCRSRKQGKSSSPFGPGPVRDPLVSSLGAYAPGDLQKIVLGLDGMPPAGTRPILQKLQSHPDVRVQLYANGLLNDHLDQLERRLALLKERAADSPRDEEAHAAVADTYLRLFRDRLVAPDEEAQIAAQALRETETALAQGPSNVPVLAARVEFHILCGQFREAAIGIEQLRQLPVSAAPLRTLKARLRYEVAAAQDLPRPPSSGSVADGDFRSAQN